MSNWRGDRRRARVALVRPATDRRRLYGCFRHLASRQPPLGLLYIASYLADRGREVVLLDGEAVGWRGLIQQLVRFRPDVVGVTSTTFSFFDAARIMRAVRQEIPDALMLMGGPHASALPVDSLQRIAELDGAIIGEGEETLLDVTSGSAPEQTPGLAWREQNTITMCDQSRGPVEDLDRYHLRWDMLEGFPHAYQPAWQSRRHGLSAALVASRGCRFPCSFCASAAIHGRSHRAHSPEYVVDMMTSLSVGYGVEHFYFHDDHFASDAGWLHALCQLLTRSGRGLLWSCASRVEPLSDDVLHMMRQAGCVQIGVGLESGSDNVLRGMAKGVTPGALREGLQRIRSAGIGTKAYVIIGTENETVSDIAATWRMIRSAQVEHIQVLYYTPLPGSPAYSRRAVDSDYWPRMNLLSPMPGAALPGFLLRLAEFGIYGHTYGSQIIRRIGGVCANRKGRPASRQV